MTARWVYIVKLVLDPPVTLPWCIYRQSIDAPAVTRLVALAGTEADAQRIARMFQDQAGTE